MTARVLIALVVFAAPAFAQGVPQRAPVDPYKKLFQQPSLEQTARAQKIPERVPASQPRVGMLCVEGKQDRLQYCIRTIEPNTVAR